MAEMWKHAKAYGVDTHELEERILVQMMFTGADLPGNFEIYLSYNQRQPKEYVQKAYLTYMSREAFVKKKELDGRFYFLLEEELLSKKNYAEICVLAYIKELSNKQTLSAKQAEVVKEYLKDFFAKKTYYAFMQKFGKIIPEALILEDKVFIDYYAQPNSEVILHYIIEKRDEEKYRYTTCKLYPIYGGMFSKAITLFDGEKITYFITERKEDGSERSMPSVTLTKEKTVIHSGTKYNRINRMREFLMMQKEKELTAEANQCRVLEIAAEQLFPME